MDYTAAAALLKVCMYLRTAVASVQYADELAWLVAR